jgi:hypothetical protein
MEKIGWSPNCPVPGCSVASSSGRYMDKHAEQPHVKCSCGWVGVYWNKHMAMMRRKEDTREHMLEGPIAAS